MRSPSLCLAALCALAVAAHARVLSPNDLPPGYPPLKGEDITQYLYKLDPAIAEEFKRQKTDLEEQYRTVSEMAAKLKAERDRIRAEYPEPRDPSVDTPMTIPKNHTVKAGETLLSIARQYGLTVEDVYVLNIDSVDARGLFVGQELSLPAKTNAAKMVPASSLLSCQNTIKDTALKVELCHKDLVMTAKERDNFKDICKINEQMESDSAKAGESVAKMQSMIAELKAAKNCK